MKIINYNGKFVGDMHYTDGVHVRVGDFVKLDKVYVVQRRVWEAAVGEITTLIVREVTPNELNDDE